MMLDRKTQWRGPQAERSADLRRDGIQDVGQRMPDGRLFVRNGAPTPVIDVATWRLQVYGTGLRGRPEPNHAVTFSYAELLALPARTIRSELECTGHRRTTVGRQQGTPEPGPGLAPGAVGEARWTGPLLYDVLELAGITFDAVSLLAEGLDRPVHEAGVDPRLGRRPLPVEQALDDVLVVYAMNGRPLPPDRGSPVRLIVPGSGVDSVKWLDRIEVSD